MPVPLTYTTKIVIHLVFPTLLKINQLFFINTCIVLRGVLLLIIIKHKAMTITKIKFQHCPDFKDLWEIAKQFYVQKDLSASGGYSIVLELSGNGKVNTKSLYAS
jgi:hypothetical protein